MRAPPRPTQEAREHFSLCFSFSGTGDFVVFPSLLYPYRDDSAERTKTDETIQDLLFPFLFRCAVRSWDVRVGEWGSPEDPGEGLPVFGRRRHDVDHDLTCICIPVYE
jgi:hypothetical protein